MLVFQVSIGGTTIQFFCATILHCPIFVILAEFYRLLLNPENTLQNTLTILIAEIEIQIGISWTSEILISVQYLQNTRTVQYLQNHRLLSQ